MNLSGEKATHVLRIDSSARGENSVTRKLANEVIRRLDNSFHGLRVTDRDVAAGIPFINTNWVDANFTDAEQRSPSQRHELALSDQLVSELKLADVIVLCAPIYNFSVPAALKAWIDLVCRARETFRYSEKGPVGMLENKTVYLVMASGGVPFGSDMDFASGYLKQVLGFIGIENIRPVLAEGINTNEEQAEQRALEMLDLWLPETAVA